MTTNSSPHWEAFVQRWTCDHRQLRTSLLAENGSQLPDPASKKWRKKKRSKIKKKKKKCDIFSSCRNKKQSKMKANTKQQRHFATSEVTYIRTRRGSLKTWLSIISHAPWPSDSIRSSSIRSGLSWLSTQIKMLNIQFTFSCVYCSLWCVFKENNPHSEQGNYEKITLHEATVVVFTK